MANDSTCADSLLGSAEKCNDSNALAKIEMGPVFLGGKGDDPCSSGSEAQAALHSIAEFARSGHLMGAGQCNALAAQLACGIRSPNSQAEASSQLASLTKEQQLSCFCSFVQECSQTIQNEYRE